MGWEAAIFIFNSMTAGLSPQSPRPVGWDNSAVSSGEISRTHVSQLTCQQESQCFLKLTPQVVNKKRETKSGPRHRSKIGSALTVSFFKQLPQLSFGEKRWKGKGPGDHNQKLQVPLLTAQETKPQRRKRLARSHTAS